MFIISKEFTFDAAHRLWKYEGKCGEIHGHTWKIRVLLKQDKLQTEGNNKGMIKDFGEIKSSIVSKIKDWFDHKLILEYGDPLIPVLEEYIDNLVVFHTRPTSENLSKSIYDAFEEVYAVQIWETPTSYAYYEGNK